MQKLSLVAGVGLEPTTSGYEPDELPTALPRTIGVQYSKIDNKLSTKYYFILFLTYSHTWLYVNAYWNIFKIKTYPFLKRMILLKTL